MVALVLESRIDSSKFTESWIDDSVKSPTEGGYINVRRRYTRGPLKTFTVGWSDLRPGELSSLLSFYDTHRTDAIFQFTHPITAAVYDVRFENPITPRYIGRGGFQFWTVDSVTLVEA